MKSKKYSIEDKIRILRQADAGESIQAVCREHTFFGAMTYIGNGPNLMVKSIADHANVHAPGFFAYIIRYAVPILLPLLIIIGLLFFSPWRVL
jgi:Na+/H+ antiporter NhaD/arsenite permease-like protein